MRSNRGHIMLQKSRAKNAPKPIPSVTYYCFKCKFFSTSEDLIANHMTYLHLVPPQSVNGKFIALSNTNLLHSTFLPTSAIEEHLEEKNSSKNESNHEEDDEIFGWGGGGGGQHLFGKMINMDFFSSTCSSIAEVGRKVEWRRFVLDKAINFPFTD